MRREQIAIELAKWRGRRGGISACARRLGLSVNYVWTVERWAVGASLPRRTRRRGRGARTPLTAEQREQRRKAQRDSQKARRDRLRDAGRCINEPKRAQHGPPVKGGRCAMCWAIKKGSS